MSKIPWSIDVIVDFESPAPGPDATSQCKCGKKRPACSRAGSQGSFVVGLHLHHEATAGSLLKCLKLNELPIGPQGVGLLRVTPRATS